MTKRLLLLTLSVCFHVILQAQMNISLIGQLSFPASRGDVSDIWGYVDGNGNEYALVGLENGTSIVDISTPSSPVEVFYSPGASSIWRDLKVWNQHVYITNETGNGLKIIDMSSLPGAITSGDVYQFTGSTYPFTSAHDIYIDENGFAYIMGADNGVGGAIILDLNTNPKVPVEVGRYNDFYIHDGMARGDTLWAGCVNDGFFAVIDVSNKANPVTMATQNTPSFFTHNCWISDDGHTLFTTDEVSNAFITSYDVSNLANIQELDRIQSSPGNQVIPHNTFVKGNFVVTSYYRDGVTIHDVSNPSNMVEVGHYDTSPAFSGNGFNGCWGVYPYLPSGLLIASDIENGLFVLGPTYTPASYLEGNVTDTITTNPISGVQVDIVSTSVSTTTNILGNYQTGIAAAGTYNITFSKLGYKTKTIQNVVLTAGNTTTLNVELYPLVPFTLQGQVIESGTSNPIANAQVRIVGNSYDNTVQTNASGNFTVSNFIEGNYDMYIGKWGYEQLCLSNENLNLAGNPHVYQLNTGYYDDFTLDQGWTVSGNASAGSWEKGEPVGTMYTTLESNPDVDVQTDCMDEAFVTGNGGGNAGDDDVDGGQTVLTSPVFDLSGYVDPYIHFDRWFFNDGGFGTPNDSLVIELSNGVTSVVLDYAIYNDPDISAWANKSVQLTSVITLTSTMQLVVRAMDNPMGHLVEAGFDKFFVVDSVTTDVAEETGNRLDEVAIYPNPFNQVLNIRLGSAMEQVHVEVYEITGKLIDAKAFKNTGNIQWQNNYQPGIYFIKVTGNGSVLKTQKIVKL
ncbi:MAG: choice-of-anchor B family protein [Flavobacteriales bacterium]|nr:choice-of-anchor B family protein [Flavobacteriales bacterium]